MNIVVEKQPKCVATLSVEIPAEKVNGERERIAKGYTTKARISGFRPGKAPRSVVEKRFQKEITEELNGALINEAYDAALKQEDLQVLDFGVPEDLVAHPDGTLTFKSLLTLAPRVTLQEYKNISVTVPPLAVPEEEVTGQLTALQERFAEFNDIEGREVEMGDFTVIDFSTTVDGKPTEEFLGKSAGYLGGQEGFWVKMSEEAFLPGFVVQLVGMNLKETREITITLPEDFPILELRGKELVSKTTLAQLKTAVLAPLDDDFANKLAPGQTMEGVSKIIRDNLANERNRKIVDSKVNQIVAHLISLDDFDLPEALLQQETQGQANAIVNQGMKAGMTQPEIEAQQDEIFASAREQATVNLRSNFILQEIVRAEKIVVNDQDLINHLVQIANSRKVAPKKFIGDMQSAGRIPNIRNSMAIGKAIDFLVEHANVTESEESTLDA